MLLTYLQRLQGWLLIGLRLCLLLTLPVSLFSIINLNTSSEQPQPSTQVSNSDVKKAAPKQPDYHFPAGDRQLFPAIRLVALYGTPGDPLLGALGEQPPAESIARAKQLASVYQPLMKEHAYPALELITTIASSEPTSNNDFSREVPISSLKPWVSAAKAAGVYVVLDLQPGRSNFLDQAKQYEPLLREPNVGLALDPEWRMQPGKQHLVDIGSVSIDEVNATGGWLAALTKQHKLPQKLFLLHEFRLSMISDRQKLDTSHPELAPVIQMDGQGPQSTKLDTYATITAAPPRAVRFGWKNFYAKDTPTRSPADTMAVTPQPWYVSYQ